MGSSIKDVMVKFSFDASKATKAFKDFGTAITLIKEMKNQYENHRTGNSIIVPIIEKESDEEITDPAIDRFEDILKEE